MKLESQSAEKRTRTSTGLPPQIPETCASTNSATSASKAKLVLSWDIVKRFIFRVPALKWEPPFLVDLERKISSKCSCTFVYTALSHQFCVQPQLKTGRL